LTFAFDCAAPGFPFRDFPDVSRSQDEPSRMSNAIIVEKMMNREETGRRVEWGSVIGFQSRPFK